MLCIFLAVLFSVMSTFVLTRDMNVTLQRTEGGVPIENITAKLKELGEKFDRVYIGDTDYETAEKYVMMSYLAGTGDVYAGYFTSEEYREMTEASYGNSQGIGINVISNGYNDFFEVLSVMPDSPAMEAGVEPGDIIAYIGIGEERESVAELGYDVALTKMRGEAGTKAEFTVLRGENLSEEKEFSIVRGHYTNQTVMSHIYAPDNSIGVIKITGFEGVTPAQFISAVEELTSKGAESLIVDLRNNPGGDKDSVCSVLDYILPEGPLLRAQETGGEITVIAESDKNKIDIPISVVVNENTASAAELFTSAMRDYNRAKIAGTVTYGKGCMQTYYPLSDGSVFKATVAMYYPPFSDNYDGVGITPDVEVELDEALEKKNVFKITDEEDNQLRAAAELLKK